MADEHSPSIVFIDEIDAIGTKRFQIVRTLIFNLKDPTHFCRYESNSGGEREIQRTMLELLNQLDGFDNRTETKVPILLLIKTFTFPPHLKLSMAIFT